MPPGVVQCTAPACTTSSWHKGALYTCAKYMCFLCPNVLLKVLKILPLAVTSLATFLELCNCSQICCQEETQLLPFLFSVGELSRSLEQRFGRDSGAAWQFDPWVGKIPWRRSLQPTPVFLSGEAHGQRILEGSSPWGCKASNTTE